MDERGTVQSSCRLFRTALLYTQRKFDENNYSV